MTIGLYTGVYEFLRGKILSGELPPHTRLKEQEVATQLGISRTPVREAFARLQMEGLIKISPRRGAVVSQIELDEIDEIYEIRAVLETLVARRACERVTEAEIGEMERELLGAERAMEHDDFAAASNHTHQFHRLFNCTSKSPRLVAMLSALDEQLSTFRRRSLRHPGRAESAMRQHWGILEGLRQRNLVELQRRIEEHAEGGRISAIRAHLEEGRALRMNRPSDLEGGGSEKQIEYR